MIATLLLVFTVCFKGECHEWITETYTQPIDQALIECLHDGQELSNQDIVWHCAKPEDYTETYTPKQSRD